jgi:hypothetical protein
MTSATPGVIDVAAELDALGVHYGCADAVRHFVERARPWLAGYTEVVLGEDSFEVVTGGVGASAVSAMVGLGAALSDETRAHFAAAAARFSGVMVGVKVGFGVAVSPTLYLRCKCPVDDALASSLAELGASLRGRALVATVNVNAHAEVASYFDVGPSGSLPTPTLMGFALANGTKFAPMQYKNLKEEEVTGSMASSKMEVEEEEEEE